MYKEYFIDPNLRRPLTFFEERLLNYAQNNQYKEINVEFVYEKRLGIYWPEWLVKFTLRNLVKESYFADTLDDEYVYKLTNYGSCMLSKKRAYEMVGE